MWQEAVAKFKKGTKERIDAQKEYQRVLKQINDNVVKVNTDYANKMQKISDDLAKNEQKLTDKYKNEYNARRDSLYSFAGIFDEFEINVERDGEELLNNLSNQVDGFRRWEKELEKLQMSGVDGDLFDALQDMGPKALPDLIALNQLTLEQLDKYEMLFREKFERASTRAEFELAETKENTEKQIAELREAVNRELSTLEKEWTTELKKVTKATDDELQNMQQIGRDAGQGLIDGLASMEGALIAQASKMATSVGATIKDVLGIASPSKVLKELGIWSVEGLVIGIDSMIGDIKATAKKMAQAVVPSIPESNAAVYERLQPKIEMQNMEPAFNSGGGVVVENMHVRNDNDIKEVARELYVLHQQSRRGRGR